MQSFTGRKTLKTAGLNFEDYSIQVSIISSRFYSMKPIKTENITLPIDEKEKQKVLKENLIRLKQKYGLRGIVACVDFKHFSYHFVELPVTSKADIGKALTFEMRKYLPLPMEEYLSDFLTVQTSSTRSRNFVLAIKRDKVRWIMEAVKDAGLRLLGIRCSFFAALNHLLVMEDIRDAMFLFKNEHAYYISVINNSFPIILRAVANEDEMASEIENYMKSSNKVIYSVGIEHSKLLEKFNIKTLSLPFPELLATSGRKRGAMDLNIASAVFKGKRFDHYNYALIAASFLSVLIYFSANWFSYYKDYAALRAIETRINEINDAAGSQIESMNHFEVIDNKRRFLLNFDLKRRRNIELLRHLSTVLPNDSWLTKFSANGDGKVEIQGYARRSAALITLLEEYPGFKNVSFSSPIIVEEGREKFAISMAFER